MGSHHLPLLQYLHPYISYHLRKNQQKKHFRFTQSNMKRFLTIISIMNNNNYEMWDQHKNEDTEVNRHEFVTTDCFYFRYQAIVEKTVPLKLTLTDGLY
jgi:hypothetical protein